MSADEAKTAKERVRTTEDMLTRAIGERKKALAQMALETLRELSPTHPRLAEYATWVQDLDQEMAFQARVDEILAQGRTVLRAGDLSAARRHLETLRKLAPHSVATEDFGLALDAAAEGQAARAGIGRLKEAIEEAIAEERPEAARAVLAQLEATDVPRVTVQTLAKRIDDLVRRLRDSAESDAMAIRFERALQAHDWHGARAIAQQFGERFPDDDRPTSMFNRVAEVETAERRRQSLQQGLAQLEGFLVSGRKAEAELALRLLRKDLDAAKIAELESRLRAL